ncbi:MAG: PAS domain-containing sensor histidine kinase [Gammaproteobacteria bacterium]
MNQPGIRQAQGLQDAFSQSNKVSEQLTTSYQGLQSRLANLTNELANARAEHHTDRDEQIRLTNRLEHLLNALPAAVVVLDGEGVIQQVNAIAIELVGEPLLGLYWRDVIKRALRTNDNGDIVTSEGRIVSVSTSPLGDEPGQIIVLQEITQARLLQEMLDRQQRLSSMGEMLATLAHQIRTPLASCLLYTAHLNRKGLTEADLGRCSEKISSRLKHLERMVNDMLVFARGGKMGNDLIGMQSLFEELKQIVSPIINSVGGTLRIDDKTANLCVTGNRDALVGVLYNLVTNAVEAWELQSDNDQLPTLELEIASHTVGAQRDTRTVEILVKDNGPGIPSGKQENIFEPFYTTKQQGTGLGLAVAKVVVNAHQGFIWFDSIKGQTTFGIRLPVTDAAQNEHQYEQINLTNAEGAPNE